MSIVQNVSASNSLGEFLTGIFRDYTPLAKKVAGGLGKITDLEAQDLEDLSSSGRTIERTTTTYIKRGPEGVVRKTTTEETETVDPVKHAQYLRQTAAPKLRRVADRLDQGIIQLGNDEINLVSLVQGIVEIVEALESPRHKGETAEPDVYKWNKYTNVKTSPEEPPTPRQDENPKLDLGPIGDLVGGEEGLFVLLSTLKPETLGALTTIIQKVKAVREGEGQAPVEGENGSSHTA